MSTSPGEPAARESAERQPAERRAVAPHVGIVLVSHSARLAAGAADLAAQVAGGTVTVIAAGGADDGGLGTSAAKVTSALARADAGAGVLVLPDLGSAVLVVRALLEDLPDAHVALADAPFVEGAVAATVAVATGADLASAAAAAREAWHARKL